MKQKLYTGLIDRYRDVLPLAADCKVISLCEGDTPLIECHNIQQANDREIKLFLKFEGLNFKVFQV